MREPIQHKKVVNIIGAGELIGYSEVLLLFAGGLFAVISIGYAITEEKQTRFYLWLLLIIVVESVAAVSIR